MGKTIEDLGYCGADCQKCNIYCAMWYGEKLKPETIQRWTEDAAKYWHVESLEPKELNCRGCRDESDDIFFGFKLCPIKKCAVARALTSCGVCPDFAGCEWIEPEGRRNIESINASE